MAEQVKETKCVAPGVDHSMEFKIAAYGYQCFVCSFCGHAEDVVEDSQP